MTDTDVSEAKNPSPATDLDEDSDEDTLALVTESNRGVELDKFRTTQWHFTAAGKTEGPFLFDDLCDVWDEGELTEETPVWNSEMKEWLPLKSCTELLTRLKESSKPAIPANRPPANNKEKKRKQKKKKGPEGPKEWFELKRNTSVYVQRLPLDVTAAEIVAYFKKAGIIKLDAITKQPKVKIYSDSLGQPKGDALVTYLKPESVDLAVKLLDETFLRDGDASTIQVQPAQFQQKGDSYLPKDTTEIRKAARQAARSQQSLFSWHEVGDENPRVVILKHMFHPDDFAEEVTLKQDLRLDMQEELGKLGTVERIRIYEHHPEGVISVKFADSLVAQKCVEKMRGRWYNGARVIADLWDNVTDYRPPGRIPPMAVATKRPYEDDSTDSEDDETADSSHIPAPTRLAPDPSPISDHLPAPPAPSATSSSSDSDPVSEAAVARDEPPTVASD